jgi:hypothetical protein
MTSLSAQFSSVGFSLFITMSKFYVPHEWWEVYSTL